MKKLFLMFSLFCTMVSCGKDDGCEQADFIGTWTYSSTTCPDGGSDKLIVSDGGSGKVKVALEDAGSTVEYIDPFTLDGCNFTSLIVDQNFDTEVTITGSLDGDKLSITSKGVFLGQNVDCVVVYTK